MDTDRLPPNSVEAEEACLGSLMIDPAAVHEVATFLKPDDFYRGCNKTIFETILKLTDRGDPLDIVTLNAELARKEKLEDVGGEPYIIGLINSVPTSLNVKEYAEIVHGRALNRKMILAASAIANLAYEEEDSGMALSQAEELLFNIRAEENGYFPQGLAKEWASEYMEEVERLAELEGELAGLPSGFIDMDRILGGFQDGQLIVVGARPSMGKTALLLQIAMHNAERGAVVGVFSLEMSGKELMQRLTSTKTGIDSSRLRRGDLEEKEWTKFYETMGHISESGLLICDKPIMTIDQIRSQGRQWAGRYGLDMVVVDYFQLVRELTAKGRVQELSIIGKGLKAMARELEVPLIAASQLNRSVENRGNKRPTLADLRDSGTIEEDADVVIFIYRDDYYNENSERPNITEINVAKNRNGPPMMMDLFWQSHLATFRNLQRKELSFPTSKNGQPGPPEGPKKPTLPVDWTKKYN